MKKMAGPFVKEISSVADMEKVLSKTETTVIAGEAFGLKTDLKLD